MWVLIDNYDSFTYILHHYLLQTGNECVVYRNDEISLEDLIAINPQRLIISPGPQTPNEAGISLAAIAYFHDKIPVLGVCLGHQAIGMFFGAKLIKAPYPMHGKITTLQCKIHELFKGISAPLQVMRYHSLVLESLENTGLQVLANSLDDNTVMAITHDIFPCVGVQFHPESIGTPEGLKLLKNWAGMYI